jgi:serine protease Do
LRPGTLKATIDGQTFLVGGDIILTVGGIEVGEPGSRERIIAMRRQLAPGAPVTVVILRDGARVELTAHIERAE